MSQTPDANCVTLPNGECVSTRECMHGPAIAAGECTGLEAWDDVRLVEEARGYCRTLGDDAPVLARALIRELAARYARDHRAAASWREHLRKLTTYGY